MEGRIPRPRCVVIFASEDDELAEHLSDALTAIGFDGWSSHQIAQGRWDVVLDDELATCDAVVPLVTRHTRKKAIFQDEWNTAVRNGKPIFPFVVDPDGTPLGLGQYSRTDASAWDGTPQHLAIVNLGERLRRHFSAGDSVARSNILMLDGKGLELPTFVYSLSTFETQLNPLDGLELISSLMPAACLVSAYDVHGYLKKRVAGFKQSILSLQKSRTALFLDSGNYEATRKNDHRARKNPGGWCRERFWEVASDLPAQVIFSFDPPIPDCDSIAKGVADIVDRYICDLMNTGVEPRVLCPIVHIPSNLRSERGIAEELVLETSKELQPTLVAIPERELGDGLPARMNAVRAIRRKLDALGYYQPLHILGTGNPISIAALAACGADSFDGLEWCRTAANYETNSLMHFQQFDLLMTAFRGRMTNAAARALAEMDTAPYAIRVASYNYDYFEGWAHMVRKWTQSGGSEDLLRIIPTLGAALTAVFREEPSA